MAEKTWIARVRPDREERETLIIASPAVGWADANLRKGIFLNPFDPILSLKILNERHTLRLPRDVHGRVVDLFVPNALTAVAFDDPILRLDPRAAEAGAISPEAVLGGEADDEEGEPGTIRVAAPSEGIFYRSPSPDAPPYVEVGSPIASGSVLGLVEVMKCFNQIAYGGPGLPDRGEIAKILVADGAEVQFGQTLFLIRPSS